MEYFSTPFHISLLKNHILKDPIIDWFNIKGKLDDNYKKDNNTIYKETIIKEYDNFKKNFFKYLIYKSNLDVKHTTSIEDTEKFIKEEKPLILGAKLLYDNMIVYTDVLINIKLFQKLFPKIKNYPIQNLKNNYIIINLNLSSLHFKNDLKECIDDGYIAYKKCLLYAFGKCFNRYFGYEPEKFIISKDYYYKKTKLSNEEYICNVNTNEKYALKFIKAYNWIMLIRTEWKNLKIDEKPSHKELYPNMNNKESLWENEKLKLATRIKEITLVWNISYDERCLFHDKNIFCWDDPKLLSELKPSKKKNIQERMIHMNKCNEIIVYPRKNVTNALREVLKEKETNNIFFDVESFLTFDERLEFFSDKKEKYENPVLAILGFYYIEDFYDFTIQNYKIESEKKIVQFFSEKLWNIYNEHGRINIFHWGQAETKYMKYIHEKYNDIEFPEYILVDLLEHFRLEPIIVQGVFKFSIKSIGKALYKNGLIKTTWKEDNDNGIDSMLKFKEICKKDKKIPLKRYLEIQNIIEYNKTDCKVLKEIYNLLQKNYD